MYSMPTAAVCDRRVSIHYPTSSWQQGDQNEFGFSLFLEQAPDIKHEDPDTLNSASLSGLESFLNPDPASVIDLESFFNFTDDSSEFSDRASTSSSYVGFSSPSSLLSPQLRTLTPSELEPTLTIAPSDLSRSESPSISDAAPPSTYLQTVRTARQSSIFSVDLDAESDCDDGNKVKEYQPEAHSKPAFISSNNRKRRLSSDEYTPETVTKKPKISSPVRPSTPKEVIKLPSVKLARARRSVKHTRVSPPARNTQVDSTTAERIEELLEHKKGTIPTWQCPGCPLYQHNRRLQDFKRHMTTHLGQVLWCIGVPLCDAEKYGISPNAQRITYMGEERVGGCGIKLSRRDAFKRHFTNPNNFCVAEKKSGRGC